MRFDSGHRRFNVELAVELGQSRDSRLQVRSRRQESRCALHVCTSAKHSNQSRPIDAVHKDDLGMNVRQSGPRMLVHQLSQREVDVLPGRLVVDESLLVPLLESKLLRCKSHDFPTLRTLDQ
jgi:hypothetical protein